MLAAFGTIHGLVGIGLTYLLVYGFVNYNHIGINFQQLSIQHQPLPLLGNKTVSVSDIKQVFTKSKLHRNKKILPTKVTSCATSVRLFSGPEKPEQAIYIKQEIENTLRIKDAVVIGELARV
ncbi:MAG: hypothetical protein CMI18_09100 [Opitutaceae bacterium]|nr:hypothetical protein [Opitutaceae bacterium]|tara:strand:- start:1204 stop:1569 length:366 start_codon:yes stop_codon:yes gene_type:complete